MREKLQEVYLKWHEGRRPLSGYLKDIEQAYADEGYEVKQFKRTWRDENGMVVMTGQEWYDRFEKDLPLPKSRKLNGVIYTVTDIQINRTDALRAAKKAAGL